MLSVFNYQFIYKSDYQKSDNWKNIIKKILLFKNYYKKNIFKKSENTK